MSGTFIPRVGGVLSADIAVPEHERELRFYSNVLTTGESPLWREDLMNSRGEPVIGLGATSPEYSQLPLQWMPHIQVADVATSVEQALQLGGKELMHGKDEGGKSLWAALCDPNGRAFGLIPVVSEDAIAPTADTASGDAAPRVGCIAWLDLTVSDASATCDFYRQVVGWSVQVVEMEDTGVRYVDYNMISAEGGPAAGVCHARGVNLGLPPIWMIHLPVGDLAESLRRVREGGGKIVKETRGKDGEYACAVIQDPVGACLALVQA
jgi:predicted enzyme related to lactoylglutathione lyase